MDNDNIFVQEDLQPGQAREVSPGLYEVIVQPDDWDRLRICKSFTGELVMGDDTIQITLVRLGPKPRAFMRRISRA